MSDELLGGAHEDKPAREESVTEELFSKARMRAFARVHRAAQAACVGAGGQPVDLCLMDMQARELLCV
jgi:hypothetical protein